jgi:hypothetical protein
MNMALMGYREILTMGSGLVDGRCPSISLSLSGNLTISWLPKQAETFSTGSTSELTSRDLSSFRNLGYSFCSKHSKHSQSSSKVYSCHSSESISVNILDDSFPAQLTAL